MDSPVSISPPGNANERTSSAAGYEQWFSPGKFALLLALFIISLFPDVLFAGKSFMFRDFGLFTYPNAYFQRESFWRGEFPLWNPYNNCGIPFLAQWNTVCLYPLTLIYLLLPLTWGLTVFFLFHLFLAGFGMYRLAEFWTHHRLAAAVAGVAFVFNGMTLNCLMWSSNLAALAWMPWVILMVERAWVSGKNRGTVLAALAAAMQILAGAPEIIVFTWVVLFALWLGRLLQNKKHLAKIIFQTAAIVGLAALLSLPQILPFLDLLSHSERTSAYGTSVWAIPIWGWANLFVPLFHCYQSPLGVYFQPTQDWTSSYYPGIGALALALGTLLFVRNRRVWLLAALAIFGFLVALGDSGRVYPLLLKTFPPLGFMRYPIKFEFLTVFAVPLLAAFGVAQLRAAKTAGSSFTWKGMGLVSLVFTVIIVGILWHVHVHPFPNEFWPVVFKNGCARIALLAAIAGCLLLANTVRQARSQLLAGLLVLALLWVDAVTHAPRQNPTADSSIYQPGLAAQVVDPLPKLGESRAFMTRQSHDLVYGLMLTNAMSDFTGRRCALISDDNLLDDVPVADGFYSLYIREQHSLFYQFLYAPTNAFPAGLADFLGVGQVSDPQQILKWQTRPTHLPFYSLGMRPEFVEPSNMPALLLSPYFNPLDVVYLPGDARKELAHLTNAPGIVGRAHFAAQKIEIEVEASAPTLLVLSQTYYPAWQATVNGAPVKIWQADYAFQAVEIPAGISTVKWVYHDRRFYAGLFAAGFTLLGCLVVLARRQTSAA